MDWQPFVLALVLLYILLGLLIASAIHRGSRKDGSEFSLSAFNMTVALWPFLFLSVIRE